jgi:hypothetical protein
MIRMKEAETSLVVAVRMGSDRTVVVVVSVDREDCLHNHHLRKSRHLHARVRDSFRSHLEEAEGTGFDFGIETVVVVGIHLVDRSNTCFRSEMRHAVVYLIAVVDRGCCVAMDSDNLDCPEKSVSLVVSSFLIDYPTL